MKQLLDVQQLCKLFNVEKKTIYRWIKQGKVKGMRIGKKYYFYDESISSILEASVENA